MKQLIKSLILLLGILLINNCFASATQGSYLGLGAGIANQLVKFDSDGLNTGGASLYLTKQTFEGRLNFGYNFDRYNGIELAPTYYFAQRFNLPTNAGDVNLSGTTLDLSYLPNLPLTANRWSIFGRVGLAYDWMGMSGATTASGNSFADVLGAGIRYNIGSSNSVRMEWIANGLLFPLQMSSDGTNLATFTSQDFLISLNFHF